VQSELSRDAMNGVTLGHAGQLVDLAAGNQAGALVFCELGDATFVAFLEAERGRDERVDVEDCLLDGVLARTDGHEVGVVVLARKLGRWHTPDKRCTRTKHLVRGNLLAVAGATEDDAEGFDACGLVAHDRARGVDAEARIVILWVVGCRSVVHDLVSRIRQMFLQIFAELETGMICANVDAHAPSLEVGCDSLRKRNIIRQADEIAIEFAQDRTVTTSTLRSEPRLRPLRATLGVGAVLLVAAVTGTLTPYGEVHLPSSISAAANSSGPWAIIAFASVYFSRIRGVGAAVLGAASLVVMDVFFFVSFEHRVGHYLHSYIEFWIAIAIVVGPLVGLCSSWLRSDHPVLREIGVAAPASILIGEGIFMLERLPGVSTLYAVASVVVGALLFVVLAGIRLDRLSRILASLLICAAASVAFFEIYGLLPQVLDKVVP
jgi:Family of unknown function (DUF6518)